MNWQRIKCFLGFHDYRRFRAEGDYIRSECAACGHSLTMVRYPV